MTIRLCSIPGCGRTHLARGWCGHHYSRWYLYENTALLSRGGRDPSKSERAVLFALAQGWGIDQIARALKVSATTVSTFRRRLLRKLKFQTDAQLAVYARETGLTKWPFEMPPPARVRRQVRREGVRA